MTKPQPTVVVVGVSWVEDCGGFLLTKRSMDTSFPGFFEFPGGKVDFEEHPRDALYRELVEEICAHGARVAERPFGMLSKTWMDADNGGRRHAVILPYEVELLDTSVHPHTSHHVDEIRYFDRTDVYKLVCQGKAIEGTDEILAQYFQAKSERR